MLKKTISIGELFCGPGGLGYAAKNLKIRHKNIIYKFRHIWATYIDKDSCNTYKKNMKCNNVINMSIQDLFKDKSTLKKLKKVDCLTFGFPCNDFSIIGKHIGLKGQYGPLYKYCVKAINYFEPDYFIAENVTGIKSAGNKNAFPKIINSFKRAGKSGYILKIHQFSFEEYEVPQKRKRIIIVGVAKHINKNFCIPAPLIRKNKNKVSNYITAYQAINYPKINKKTKNHEPVKNSQRVIERLKRIKPGENAFTAKKLKNNKKLKLKNTKTTISQIYKRLKRDEPSYTVTGSGGGGTHMYHWHENRALTNRERARLQTFPDSFEFIGNRDSQRKQIGMAVPVKGAEAIFRALLKTHVGLKYPTCTPNINLK